MKLMLCPVVPERDHVSFAPLVGLLAETRDECRLKGGYAYATLGGVESLLNAVDGIDMWRTMPKQFLIGLHHGITEPSALSRLLTLSSSETRLFIPGGRLTQAALYAKPVFHPKVTAVESRRGELQFVQSGSANLTSSAIGESPRNFEFSVAIQGDGESRIDDSREFALWWQTVWQASKVVDPRVISRYASLRLDVLERNPILRSTSTVPESISSASHFFCEVGAGSGPPGYRHQIEFPESLARFFGAPIRRRRNLHLCSDGQIWRGRPLSFKTTTYGVEIWRLGMPTQKMGGEPITERVIRFARTDDPSSFEFEIADVDSDAYRSWVSAANLGGHLGATHGQRLRQYGFY